MILYVKDIIRRKLEISAFPQMKKCKEKINRKCNKSEVS